MTKTQLLGAGTFLAFAVFSTSASAQVLNSPSPMAQLNAATAASQSAPAPTDTRRVMVVRDEWSGGYRAPISGDRGIGVASIGDFMAANQSEADFDRVFNNTEVVCSETGSFIRESIAIMAEAGTLDIDLVGLASELAALGSAQNRTSWIRRGFNVLSGGLLCTLGATNYCYGAVAAILGGEVGSTTHDRAMRLNRRASDINVSQSRLQLRATLLTMRMNIGWSKMVHGYCLQYHPDQTLGDVNMTVGSVTYTPAP